MKTHKGFTIIELMIVVTIISILAAVAIPNYQLYIAKSQVEEAFNLASGYKTLISESYTYDGDCPTTDNPSSSGNYVEQVTIEDSPATCNIVVLFKTNDVATQLKGKKLILSIDKANKNYLQFNCNSPDITQSVLPKTCTGI